MKTKIFRLLLAGVLGFSMLTSCDKEKEDDLAVPPAPQQVAMTVVVPIHPSSLEYFDYAIHYRDSQGLEYNETIRENTGGIVVEDWNYVEHEVTLGGTKAALDYSDCFIKTFNYDELSVSNVVTVEMIPKKERSSLASFLFCDPKPYIFPKVRSSSSASGTREDFGQIIESIENIRIEDMSIRSFQMTYGESFTSHCGVYSSADGYEIYFY